MQPQMGLFTSACLLPVEYWPWTVLTCHWFCIWYIAIFFFLLSFLVFYHCSNCYYVLYALLQSHEILFWICLLLLLLKSDHWMHFLKLQILNKIHSIFLFYHHFIIFGLRGNPFLLVIILPRVVGIGPFPGGRGPPPKKKRTIGVWGGMVTHQTRPWEKLRSRGECGWIHLCSFCLYASTHTHIHIHTTYKCAQTCAQCILLVSELLAYKDFTLAFSLFPFS